MEVRSIGVCVKPDQPQLAGSVRALAKWAGERGIQVLLKEVATDQLLLALRTASDDMREKIFGNVSSRAAAMLREELEMMGPVRLSDVEGAQRAMVERALALEAEGQIQIEREGGGDFV